MKEKERNIIAGEAETNETKCKRKKERKERNGTGKYSWSVAIKINK